MQPADTRQSNSAPDTSGLDTLGSSASQTHISTHEIAQMTPADVDQLAQRLEKDEYATAFEGLQDWHRLRAVAFQRSELVEPYMHLLDLEAFDES